MLGALGVILGAVAIVLVLTRRAEAAPPGYVPTVGEISMAGSFATLNAYYDQINELYISGQISQGEYLTLYSAYESRFYELMEGI